MKNTLGCLAHLVSLAALTVAIDRVTGPHVDPSLRPWVGLVSALLLVLGLSNLLHLLGGYGRGDKSRAALLARSMTGEPPSDDGPMLVTGTVRAASVPLRSPLSDVECVAYQYRIYERVYVKSDEEHQTRVYWGGYASQPFIVDTTARAVRVDAVPRFADKATTRKGEDGAAAARAYLDATRFEDVGGSELLSLFTTMFHDHAAGEGGIRRDWHREGSTPDPSALRFEEHVLPVGVTASAAGHWSRDRQVLGSEPGLTGATLTVGRGGPASILRATTSLPHSATQVVVGGVIMAALGAALAWLASQGYLSDF